MKKTLNLFVNARLFNLARTPFSSKNHSFILSFQLKLAFFEFP